MERRADGGAAKSGNTNSFSFESRDGDVLEADLRRDDVEESGGWLWGDLRDGLMAGDKEGEERGGDGVMIAGECPELLPCGTLGFPSCVASPFLWASAPPAEFSLLPPDPEGLNMIFRTGPAPSWPAAFLADPLGSDPSGCMFSSTPYRPSPASS